MSVITRMWVQSCLYGSSSAWLPKSRALQGPGQCLIHLRGTSVWDRTQVAAGFRESQPDGKIRFGSELYFLSLPIRGTGENSHDQVGRRITHPSFLAHNKLGPNTIAMLLGVILLMSLVWASFARNLIKYLWKKREGGKRLRWNIWRNGSDPAGSGAHCRVWRIWTVPGKHLTSTLSLFQRTDTLGLRRGKELNGKPQWFNLHMLCTSNPLLRVALSAYPGIGYSMINNRIGTSLTQTLKKKKA